MVEKAWDEKEITGMFFVPVLHGKVIPSLNLQP